ncbi:MAG TPA: zinc ribbon domain-containing protein [Rhodoglobus sp.]|nr:zinc ribbon domain-containing protein [Rhodoglobus sp.]
MSGEKTQTHEHYLKGSVYCGDCGSRLMVTHAKNGKGIVYPYFICAGRHSKRTNCVRQAMPIEHIERQVEDYYRRVQIPEHIVTALRQMLVRQFDDLHTANKAERHTLAAERDKLHDERRSLLHAHHAGAVPIDLLKEEQDRIARRLVFLDAQIDAGQIEYDQAKAHLEDCLALAGDMHAIYMSIDDSLRRICNQAFFERIHVYEIENADIVRAEHGEPFDALLDPNLHAAALAYQASVRAGEDVKPADVASLNIDYWVGPTGLEPMTSTV